MQACEVVAEINRAGARDEQGRAISSVILGVPVRNDRVNAVIAASLENEDQLCVFVNCVRKDSLLEDFYLSFLYVVLLKIPLRHT
ncbi:MAG: hypothetical protein ACYSUD_15490 [Planctomycetota bacterium]|jgi:hypothetical protein